MNYYPMTKQPLINIPAFIRSLSMWALLWGGTVVFLAYQGQPGVICMTPMAWLLALPAGWNYVAFADGKPGRQPFVAGALLGATLGLLFGLLCWGVGVYMMPADPAETGTLSIQQIALILIGCGAVIGALLSGMMAHRAAAQQRRGRNLPVINVK
jgi:hypothetical protein